MVLVNEFGVILERASQLGIGKIQLAIGCEVFGTVGEGKR